MKKIFKYFGVLLSVALMGLATACNPEELTDADLGLNIKVFFPTKVVSGQPMTINGSGFREATEVVFPDNVVVTDFEIVSNDMIRVNAPKGISTEGGKLIVRSSSDQAESSVSMTVGKTVVSGYSLQPGEKITGGNQITIYGTDLEFISSVELLDPDGNPLILSDKDFYRKGTSTVIIIVPKKVYTGVFAGIIHTYDEQTITMDEFEYEEAQDGGHWETTKVSVWKNDGSKGAISWSGDYRYSSAEASTGEEIYAFPMDEWNRLKTETFYVVLEGESPQIRVTTGWWSTTWGGDDIFPGNELLTDNGDGTYTLAVTLEGDPILDVIDQQHLLLTGGGYTPLEIYFEEQTWVDGGGHLEVVEELIWENNSDKGAINWSSDYRFSSAEASTGEEIYAIPMDTWNKMKEGTFYITVSGDAPQIRVTTGWWSTTWTGDDIFPGNERLTDNGDGTFTLAINFDGDPILDVLDAQHLLFTGGGYTPVKIFFREEVWVGGGEATPQPVEFWKNDTDKGAINWSSDYRFSSAEASTGEEIYAIPMDVWNKLKENTFYLKLEGESPQIRVTTGWWSTTWGGDDIFPGNEHLTDNGDGTFTLEINLGGDPILDVLDAQHLLFTGGGYTPVSLFFME